MAVKTNLSNRPVVMAMEKYISSLTDKTQNTSSHYHEVRTDKEDSRIEERTYDIVPVEALYNKKITTVTIFLLKTKSCLIPEQCSEFIKRLKNILEMTRKMTVNRHLLSISSQAFHLLKKTVIR